MDIKTKLKKEVVKKNGKGVHVLMSRLTGYNKSHDKAVLQNTSSRLEGPGAMVGQNRTRRLTVKLSLGF